MAWLNADVLWILWTVPGVIGLFLLAMWRRRVLQSRFGDRVLVSRLLAQVSGRRRRYKAALVVAGVALLGVALAGPQIGTRLREMKREGVDLVVALDVSLSMLAEDVAPNRLGRARNEIKKLLGELRGDRVGLVIFAGDAFIQCPMTTDYSAVRLFLDVANPDLLPTPGTDFGAAFQQAVRAFEAPSEAEDDGSKALLFVSDGENHVAELESILASARNEGITIYTAGVGGDRGVPIPEARGGVRGGFKRDVQGDIVTTRLEEDALKALAADGAYFPISQTSSALSRLIPALERLDQSTLATEEFEDYDLKYQWPLALALALLFIEGFLPARKRLANK